MNKLHYHLLVISVLILTSSSVFGFEFNRRSFGDNLSKDLEDYTEFVNEKIGGNTFLSDPLNCRYFGEKDEISLNLKDKNYSFNYVIFYGLCGNEIVTFEFLDQPYVIREISKANKNEYLLLDKESRQVLVNKLISENPKYFDNLAFKHLLKLGFENKLLDNINEFKIYKHKNDDMFIAKNYELAKQFRGIRPVYNVIFNSRAKPFSKIYNPKLNPEFIAESIKNEANNKCRNVTPLGVENLFSMNPYDIEGKCFALDGGKLQLMSRTTALMQNGLGAIYYADFGNISIPGFYFSGLGYGLKPYKYISTTGAEKIVPSFFIYNDKSSSPY